MNCWLQREGSWDKTLPHLQNLLLPVPFPVPVPIPVRGPGTVGVAIGITFRPTFHCQCLAAMVQKVAAAQLPGTMDKIGIELETGSGQNLLQLNIIFT